jgi:hypothetical protein
MAKLNCWEFQKCGRDPGGPKVKELGVCPAATEVRTNGVHGGKNGGRVCWVISGTMCQGIVQGITAMCVRTCFECDFYRLVQDEEGQDVVLSGKILKMLR